MASIFLFYLELHPTYYVALGEVYVYMKYGGRNVWERACVFGLAFMFLHTCMRSCTHECEIPQTLLPNHQ